MKTGDKLNLRRTSTECQSTECKYCIPKAIEGYVSGNLGIARVVYLKDFKTKIKDKLKIKTHKPQLTPEGRTKARAIMFRFVSEGVHRIYAEIKENRIKERHIRLSRPVSQRELDKWKDRPLTNEMIDELLEYKDACDLYDVIVEKLTSENKEQ